MADPWVISGIIQGLPGLVVSCAQLYSLTTAARNFNHDVNIVICRVAVEQAKFAYWLQDVGFVEGSQPTLKLSPAAQTVLTKLLEGIKETLTLLAELVERYELPRDAVSEPSAALELPERFWRLRISDSATRPKSPRLFQRAMRATLMPLSWAAAQQQRADKLLGDLRILNEDLVFVSGMSSAIRASVLPSRILAHVWGDGNLQALVEATAQQDPDLAKCVEFKREVAAALASPGAPPLSKSPLRILAPRITKRRRSDHSHLAVAELSDKKAGEAWPVLLEDKSYTGSPQATYEAFVESRVGEITAILAKPAKPANLRVLDCAGYVRSAKDKCFSFIFRFPAGVSTDADPISLQRLLPVGSNGWAQHRQRALLASPQPQHPTAQAKPSLRTRFVMARSLSQSLALLQACGVLHKGLTPANILFFREQEDEVNTVGFNHSLSRPYISGFSWARLHGPGFVSDHAPSKDFASTSGLLHSHPAYSFSQEQRYLKIFDLYCLGLVLMQIGLWRSLQDVADDLFPSPKSRINVTGALLEATAGTEEEESWLRHTLTGWQDHLATRQHHVAQSDGLGSERDPRRSFQEALVQNVDRLLLADMGEIYTRVVARCLTGDIENDGVAKCVVDRTSDEGEPEYLLQDAVVRNIVEELERCNA